MKNFDIFLPAPEGQLENPIWDGDVFRIGKEKVSILEYSENFDGWNDDLTALHEGAAGDNHPIDVASRKHAIAEVAKAIKGKERDALILEVGCSSGYLLKEMVDEFPTSTVAGADVVKEPLEKLSHALPGVPLFRFDLLQCPLPHNSVDVLIMINVLEHIEDDVTAMQKAFALLKPGGTFVIEVPAGPGLFDAYDVELSHYRRYRSSFLRTQLQNIGFEIKNSSHLGFLLYPAFAIVKLKNKWFGSRANVAVKRVKSTSVNPVLKTLVSFETYSLRKMSLPCGIRVLITAMKPL